jgi:hypothetical protein
MAAFPFLCAWEADGFLPSRIPKHKYHAKHLHAHAHLAPTAITGRGRVKLTPQGNGSKLKIAYDCRAGGPEKLIYSHESGLSLNSPPDLYQHPPLVPRRNRMAIFREGDAKSN